MRRWIPGVAACFAFAALCCALLSFTSRPVFASDVEEKPGRVISVVGEATLKVRPDTAKISLGVEAESKSAHDAVRQNAQVMQGVMEALRAAGLRDDQISTACYSVFSFTKEEEISTGPAEPKKRIQVTYYRCTNVITASTEDLSAVGRLIDAAVSKGANRVDGISYEVKDLDMLKLKALRQASEQALRKATAIAEGFGAKITGLLAAREQQVCFVPFRISPSSASPDASWPSTEVLPGEVTVTASVNAEFGF